MNRIDVAVIGAGLSGLTCAALLAREGRNAVVFEGSSHLGGRAQSPMMQGLPVNLGPHALYLGGHAFEVLTDLGLNPQSTPPVLGGANVLRKDRLSPLPSTLWKLFSTTLLTVPERFAMARVLMPVLAGRSDALPDESLAQWLTRSTSSLALRQLLEGLFRLTTYANAPEHFSAAAACRQLSLALRKNVAYGAFEPLVAALRALPGVNVQTSKPVRSVSAQGVLRFDDGEVHANDVVLALPLEAATKVFHDSALEAFHQSAVPAKAACLDVVVSALTAPATRLVLGLDEPLYASVHQEHEGKVVLQLAKYLAVGERGADVLPRLERLADQYQPGWRQKLLARRFMPELVVSSALPLAKNAGRGFGLQLGAHLFAASDWASGGVLADAGIHAAREVASLLSAKHLKRSASCLRF